MQPCGVAFDLLPVVLFVILELVEVAGEPDPFHEAVLTEKRNPYEEPHEGDHVFVLHVGPYEFPEGSHAVKLAKSCGKERGSFKQGLAALVGGEPRSGAEFSQSI